jgi:hypothetical protein
MMRYELGNGKTILISFEEWLEMDDLFIQKKKAEDAGIFITDPFNNFDGKERIENFEVKEIIKTKVPDEANIAPEELDEIEKQFNSED